MVTAFDNDGKHNLSQHLVYEPTTGLLYCAFAASGDDGNEYVITTIDPDTLVMVDIFDGLIAAIPIASGILAITTDSTYIYAGTKSTSAPSWVLRFLLDGTYVDGVALANANARRLHAIKSDGTRLYVQGTKIIIGGTVGWVAWLELDLSAQAYLQIGTKIITDDTLLIGSDFWIAEESASGTVHAVAKDLGTDTSVDTSALGTTGFDGMMYDGTYVWAVMRNNPSTVIAIDPVSKTVVTSYALLTGENTVNEILPYDGGHILLTYQTSGRAIFQPRGALSAAIAPNASPALGTGQANQPSVDVQANAGVATGTGSALQPTAIQGREAPAELASGTGSAFNATVKISSSAEVAAGTGASNQPSTSVKTNAGVATGNAGIGASSTTYASDTFTEASNTGLTSHTPDVGTSWAVVSTAVRVGTFSVVGATDRLAYTEQFDEGWSTYDIARPLDAAAIRDVDVSMAMGDGVGQLVTRWTNAGGYLYAAAVVDTAVELSRYVAYSTTLLSRVAHGLGAAEKNLKLEATGASPTALRVRGWLVGGSEPGTWFIDTNDSTSGLQVAAASGIACVGDDTGLTFDLGDNFRVAEPGVSGYSNLNAAALVGPTAGAAAGTGAANQPSTNVKAKAGVATGTGSAYAAIPSVSAMAGIATGTGSAYSTTTKASASAEVATGTGSAHAVAANTQPNADVASGTGSASGATADVKASAGLASGTGTAYGVTEVGVPTAEVATGAGSAFNAAAAVEAGAGTATGTGAAGQVSANVSSNAEAVAGVGAAYDATTDVKASAGVATGTGTALDATGSASVLVDAPAEVSIGTGAAYDAAAAIESPAGVATGTGVANQPSTDVKANAEVATGTGSAYDGTVVFGQDVFAYAEVATGTGDAFGATSSIGSTPSTATGTGVANGPSISVAGSATFASGVATAYNAVPSVGPRAVPAYGIAEVYAATTDIVVHAGVAEGTGTAYKTRHQPLGRHLQGTTGIAVGPGAAVSLKPVPVGTVTTVPGLTGSVSLDPTLEGNVSLNRELSAEVTV